MSAAGERGFKSSRRSAQQGFTLIEMLVTLAVAGLVGGIMFPAVERTIARRNFEAAGAALRLLLVQTRADALRDGAVARLTASPDGRVYGRSGGVGERLPEGLTLALPPRGIAFFGDGSSTGGALVLSGGAAAFRLDVDAATGAIGSAREARP